MASPQAEDGHIDIANEIGEALCRINLSAYESRVLWFIFRRTYGWHKKSDRISYTQMEQATGLKRRHIARTISRLEERKIIVVDRDATTPAEYSFQKDYDQWIDELGSRTITSIGNSENSDGTITSTGNSTITSTGNGVLPKEVTELLPVEVTTKERKENKQKKVLKKVVGGRSTTTSKLSEKNLELLKLIQGLPYWARASPGDDLWLTEFLEEFPEFDISAARACRDYHSGKKAVINKGHWKSRFRNWMRVERERGNKQNEQRQQRGIPGNRPAGAFDDCE